LRTISRQILLLTAFCDLVACSANSGGPGPEVMTSCPSVDEFCLTNQCVLHWSAAQSPATWCALVNWERGAIYASAAD